MVMMVMTSAMPDADLRQIYQDIPIRIATFRYLHQIVNKTPDYIL